METQKQLDKNTDHIATMFNDIAPQYDFLNHFLSLGIDKLWRRKIVRTIVKRNPAKILDVATGTGDVAFLLQKKTNAEITAIDISEGMLEIAKKKQVTVSSKQYNKRSKNKEIDTLNYQLPTVAFSLASAEALPFANNSFDAVTVSFGVRNFENLDRGLDEMFRVLKPNGVLVIAEFSTPKTFPVKQFYQFYFHTILPIIGRFFSKHKSAYKYLPASVTDFPQRTAFIAHLEKAGFIKTRFKALSCGIAMLYTAEK